MATRVASGLAAAAPALAALPALQVLLAWDPQANRDLGWLVLLEGAAGPPPASLANTGLVLRDWNLAAGFASDEEGGAVRLLSSAMARLPDRTSWRVLLAWDSYRNEDVGWLALAPASLAPALSSLQLRRWNLALTSAPRATSPSPPLATPPPSSPSLSAATSPQSADPSSDMAACPLCSKTVLRRGLKMHLRRMHPDAEYHSEAASVTPGPVSTKKAVADTSSKEPSMPKFSKTTAARPQPKPEISSPRPSSGPPGKPGPASSKRAAPTGREEGKTRPTGEDKCFVMFTFEGRKLKLTTLARKAMGKAMAEFARYRGLPAGSLVFRSGAAGEEVEAARPAGDYSGRLVTASRR